MIFGGSPHIVDEPPRLAQKISASIIGTGLKPNNPESSTVTAAKKSITVMLSINIASTADISIKVTKIGTVRQRTSFAIFIQSQRKKPTRAIPSTITIIPAIKTIVSQFIPQEASADSPGRYQKSGLIMLPKLRVSFTASRLCIHTPKTSIRVSAPQPRVTYCRSILSVTISKNIPTKITAAMICEIIVFSFLCFCSFVLLPFCIFMYNG